MGFNIAGVVLDENYKGRELEVAKDLGWDLEFVGEISFEEASENWKDESICDFYFSEKGTLIFTSFEDATQAYAIKGREVLTFCLSEMSMNFIINYSKSHEVVRSLIVSEDTIELDEGAPLPEEKDEDDMSEVIRQCISNTLGEKWDDIDLESKAYRFKRKAKNSSSAAMLDEELEETEIEQLEADADSVNKRKRAVYRQTFWVVWLIVLFVIFVTRGTTMGYIFGAVDVVMLIFYAVRLKSLINISREMGDFEK